MLLKMLSSSVNVQYDEDEGHDAVEDALQLCQRTV